MPTDQELHELLVETDKMKVWGHQNQKLVQPFDVSPFLPEFASMGHFFNFYFTTSVGKY